MERDAHHLDNQQGESASVQGLSPEPDETMRTGKEQRMEKGASPTLDADGKPYGHDEDPDSTGTKAGTLGGIGGCLKLRPVTLRSALRPPERRGLMRTVFRSRDVGTDEAGRDRLLDHSVVQPVQTGVDGR